MLSRTQRQLKAVEQEMERHADEANAVIEKAADENRDRTDDENAEIAEHQRAIKTLKQNRDELDEQIAVEKEIQEVGTKIGTSEDKSGPAQPRRPLSMGEQFVQSEGFKALQAKGVGGGFWTTGKVELDAKHTLLEGELTTSDAYSGSGGVLVPVDQQPGVQPVLFERLTVAALLASGTTNSDNVRYVVETVADAGSIGTVAEGGVKPEADLEFDTVDTPVRKIASFLPVSDEMLSDAATIQSYINARLSLFVRQEEENQLLNGTGGGTDLDGLLNNVPAPNQGVISTATAANQADNIFAAITAVRDAFLEPDGVVVNTDDWADLRLLKDGDENYIGGSPFSNTGSNPGESLWGKPVVVTSAITSGTALVGAFRTGAQIYRNGGLTVEASNSHSDYFRRNLTAIRAEERLALAVYRPEAFATADVSS